MSTTKTRSELVQEALQILVPLSTNDHSAEDRDYVDGKVEPMLARLKEEGITYIPNPDAIPLEQFSYLAIILASSATENFATVLSTVDPAQAEQGLRAMRARAPSYAVLEACYF